MDEGLGGASEKGGRDRQGRLGVGCRAEGNNLSV